MNRTPRSNRAFNLNPAVVARLGVAAIALFVVACQTPAAAPPASPSVPPIAIGNPSTPPAPSADPSADPTTPAPTPKPKPIPQVRSVAWSKPVTIKGLETCRDLVLAVDERGVSHLAGTCGMTATEIRYATSPDGKTWTTTVLEPPADRQELEPQLAFSGNTLYLAYTRVAPSDGACGDDGLEDLGVHVRSRTLPGGDWSEPTQVGKTADHLRSFRADGTVLHATVTNEKDGSTAYEVLTGGALARHVIRDAIGGTALRVGDDGKGRVAYETAKGINYGMVANGTFTSATIPGSKDGWNPVLTLVSGNVAYVAWTRSDHGDGCIDGGPQPVNATFFATNASGTWVTRRVTTMIGAMSMTVDSASGEVNLAISDTRRLVRFHGQPGTDWAHETVSRDAGMFPVLRQDPTNGTFVLAFVGEPGEAPDDIQVKVMIGG